MAWYLTWALISLVINVVGGTIQVGGQSRITEDFLFLYVLLPTIGLLMGVLQYVLLCRYLPRMAWWIAATFVGWLLPFVLGSIITAFLARGSSTLSIMFGLSLIGVTIALPQWWLLRRRVHHAFWWILAYGLGWSTVGLLNYFTSEPFHVLLAIALMPTLITGIAWWLLLNGSANAEVEARKLAR
jgi:hypothetical protein